MEVRGGEDEDGVRRGLFERLEKGVEGALRKHVDFVHQVDLLLQVAWGEADLLAQFAHVIDAAVAGCVHLDQVEGGAVGDGDAGGAFVAGVPGGEVHAIHRTGENPRRGGLASAARPAEEVGMGKRHVVFGDATLAGSVRLGEGVSQGRDNVVLPNNFFEALGTPLTVKHQRLGGLGCDKYRTDVPGE